MLTIDFLIILLLICSVILLSGVKIMFSPKYVNIIMFLLITYTPLSDLIEGYKLGYNGIDIIILVSILFLFIFIWRYRITKHIYSIHNVKRKDVINIIEESLEIKNIKYELREIDMGEIYLPEFDETIKVNGLIETTLDCRDIKDMDFYYELVEKVRVGIREIKRRSFSMEGMFYLFLAGILYWLRITF